MGEIRTTERHDDSMPTESKALTAERIRKEVALASLRELLRAERRGELVEAAKVEVAWSSLAVRIRDAVLAIPNRVLLNSAIRVTPKRSYGGSARSRSGRWPMATDL
jgi:phage terminase Nu1 subunit (DNA packaging protein)